MAKNLLYIFICSLLFISCSKEKELIIPAAVIAESLDNSIVFELKELVNAGELTNDIICQVNENQITGYVPYRLKSDSLVATFNLPPGAILMANDKVQVSGVTKNDLSKPVNYTLITQKGTVKKYTFVLSSFTGLPIIHINTEQQAPIDSKDEYLKAHLKITGNSTIFQGLYDGGIQIKGRGNSTWTMPKKPYKIMLDQKAQLLDMPADKEWVLLANYSDKTLMRNYVAFELSRRLGLSFTPRSRFVEVFINKEYAGNYLLTEQIKISKDRVNIKELSPSNTSNDLITGGYLVEVDARLNANNWFKTNKGVAVCIKSPENIAPKQLEYLNNYFQETENVIYADKFADPKNGYAKYINVNSFVNWYLLNEITKNHDALFYTSVFMYKDRDGKLSIGPAWDFDISLGNINYNNCDNPEGFYINNSVWFHRLFQDPAFYAKVKDRFNQLKASKLYTLDQYIDQTAATLDKSQVENFGEWKILNSLVWPNAVALGSYDKEVDYLQTWYQKRVSWLDQEFNKAL